MRTSQSNEATLDEPSDEIQELLKTLPLVRNFDGLNFYFYDGFWLPSTQIKAMVSFQAHFKAHDTDVIVATSPKSGTTWLAALTFSLINRTKYAISESPLHTTNPLQLVPSFEFNLYNKDENPNLEDIPCPRLFLTHIPFDALPQTIVNSKCRILYICRNPLDQFISYWHFMLKMQHDKHIKENPPSIDEAFELFCRGVHGFGPFWDHEMGYWRACIKYPHKVLFLKYEDLKEDINSYVRKIGEFLGLPFSTQEEKQGMVEEISSLCSFENLKNLKVNKEGTSNVIVEGGSNLIAPNSSFFRKGQIGDWTNFLSPSQAEHLEKIAKDNLSGSEEDDENSAPPDDTIGESSISGSGGGGGGAEVIGGTTRSS
ncbi:hypothetical protein LguiA_029937 [Lonicera macranthoides]